MNIERKICINKPKRTRKILYLMFNAFRINYNHALKYAIETKGDVSIYLYHIKEANQRNNEFFNIGITNYKDALQDFSNDVCLIKDIHNIEVETFDYVVIDMGYLKEEKELISYIKSQCDLFDVGLSMIESNTIVPITVSSNKEEYSAKTIRKKVWNKVPYFIDIEPISKNMFTYEREAYKQFSMFVESKLINYDMKNHPELNYTSNISKYLKYGFISPLMIYSQLEHQNIPGTDTFFEELIIRRDLAYNFVYYNESYDTFRGMTYEWAYRTMENHIFDKREYLYTVEDYKNFNTHDKYFNAAMKEMVYLGKMHGYMRMYWAKKIIEWSINYEDAYKSIIYLNNYYFLDGNTPNGYTGVAWCFGKHDRAWKEREVFGKLRYMNRNGLKRKFDIDKYIEKVEKEVGALNE